MNTVPSRSPILKRVLHGDLGESNVYRKGVAITEIIAEKIPISLELGLISLCIALALGLPLGAIMADSRSEEISA